ncbi:hypothetical protein, partial [Paenibacillus lautus]|uniref:hypothetical protein n=1 Tax=Paenibacillus lautus TaxID=1401 RepID=UPI001C7CE670
MHTGAAALGACAQGTALGAGTPRTVYGHKTCSVRTVIPLFANKGTKIKLKRTLVPLLPAYHSKKQAKAENNGFCVRKALNLALLLANSGPPVRISPCILHIIRAYCPSSAHIAHRQHRGRRAQCVHTGAAALGACAQGTALGAGTPRTVYRHKTCSVRTVIPLFANKGTKIKLKRTLVPLLPAYHSK